MRRARGEGEEDKSGVTGGERVEAATPGRRGVTVAWGKTGDFARPPAVENERLGRNLAGRTDRAGSFSFFSMVRDEDSEIGVREGDGGRCLVGATRDMGPTWWAVARGCRRGRWTTSPPPRASDIFAPPLSRPRSRHFQPTRVEGDPERRRAPQGLDCDNDPWVPPKKTVRRGYVFLLDKGLDFIIFI